MVFVLAHAVYWRVCFVLLRMGFPAPVLLNRGLALTCYIWSRLQVVWSVELSNGSVSSRLNSQPGIVQYTNLPSFSALPPLPWNEQIAPRFCLDCWALDGYLGAAVHRHSKR
jgi:hypothetical protein